MGRPKQAARAPSAAPADEGIGGYDVDGAQAASRPGMRSLRRAEATGADEGGAEGQTAGD